MEIAKRKCFRCKVKLKKRDKYSYTTYFFNDELIVCQECARWVRRRKKRNEAMKKISAFFESFKGE